MAQMITEAFPRKGGIVTTSQALSFFTQRTPCPGHLCPRGGDKAVAQCFEQFLMDCPGGGPIPYVLSEATKRGLGDQRNAEVDSVIRTHFEAIGHHRGEALRLSLYSLERKRLRSLSQQLKNSP
jgi:hypothetical protein